jgi:hypothetical protein
MSRDLPEYRASRLAELFEHVRQARLKLERVENLVIIEPMELYLVIEGRAGLMRLSETSSPSASPARWPRWNMKRPKPNSPYISRDEVGGLVKRRDPHGEPVDIDWTETPCCLYFIKRWHARSLLFSR